MKKDFFGRFFSANWDKTEIFFGMLLWIKTAWIFFENWMLKEIIAFALSF